MDFLYSLDKDGSTFLYQQLYQLLLDAIRQQLVKPGQKMPSATEMSKITGVSRMTVRQAIQRLVNEGWLYTVPGNGTFVASNPHLVQNLQVLMGWTEETQAQGYTPSSKLVSAEVEPADANAAANLKVIPGTPVYSICRVRYADQRALAVETANLIVARYPGLLDEFDDSTSLYHLLRHKYGVKLLKARQLMDVGEANRQIASLLDTQVGKPVMLLERTTYTYNEEPVEFVISIYKPGFVRMKTELIEGVKSNTQLILQ